jgi:hypothetical protein
MKLPKLPRAYHPGKPTKQEHQRMLMCAYRRKLTLNGFITKLVRRQFSVEERLQIMNELGEHLHDKLFSVAEGKKGRL